MYNDYANLQSILDKKHNEVDILRSDIASLIQENNILKQEKIKADITVITILYTLFHKLSKLNFMYISILN